MSLSHPENIRNIINSYPDGPHSDINGSWFKNTYNKYANQYSNGKINISPQYHKDVYGEQIDLDNREITPCVSQHIAMFYCYAGGFNNNDYYKLPIEYRRHFHKMVHNESTERTVSNCINVANKLIDDYNMPETVSYVIAWYWTSGEQFSSIIVEDSTQ